MKRVLLIAYCFAPEPLPGAQRPAYIARYARRFGWDVTVLTHASGPPPFSVEIVRVGGTDDLPPPRGSITRSRPTAAVRAALRAARDTFAFPDVEAPWIPAAIARGLRELRAKRYDAIFTTALPFSSHVAGAVLSAITGTPWIADYRDAWSGNPYTHWGPLKRSLERALELAALRRASQITTVSEELAQHLRDLHGRDVAAIQNAYDSAEWESIPQEQPAAFDLVYTGTMYGGKRSPELLFRALAELREEGEPLARDARVHFYGPANEQVLQQARDFGIESQVEVHGIVPREQAMREQRRAAGLLIFLNMDPATATERGSKYLEYAGARRPMLVVGPERSVMRETVDRGGLGWFASNTAEAKAALRSLYGRYAAGNYELTLDAAYLPTSVELTRQFTSCFDRAAGTLRIQCSST